MPTNLVKTEHDEKLWSSAKAQAKAQGHAEDWAYVNSIYQSMKKEGMLSKLAAALNTRRGHVRQETLRPIPNYSYMPVRITIQEHLADRRGLHWDLRIVTPRTALSFVIPRPKLEGEPGDRNTWIRMPDHRKAYADWSGTIPHGQYGGGTVKVVKNYNGVLNTRDGKLDLFFDTGGQYQKISITPGKDKKMYYAIHRSLPKEHHWQDRPQYKAIDTISDNLMASEKLDGALVYAVLGANGITFTSRRKSTSGELIQKENHVPWLRDTKVPKQYQGLILAGELVHPKGFSFLTPILNSSPHNAVKLQHLFGRVQFRPHNVLNRSMTYKEKVELLQGMAKNLNNKLISTPKYSNNPDELWNEVKRKGGEGIVLFDPESADPTMYKKKLWQTYTGEVVSIDPGTGKYSNALGSMLVMDKNGNTVRIGGGQGLTDEMRREIFENPRKYLGKKIRVVAQGTTGRSLRQPRFHGWDLDERPLDIFGPGDTLYNLAHQSLNNNLEGIL